MSDLNVSQTLTTILDILQEHTKMFQKLQATVDEHSIMLRNHSDTLYTHSVMLETLEDIQKQTAKIPVIENDIRQIKNEVSLMRAVLTDNNQQLRRHEKFIQHIKASPFLAYKFNASSTENLACLFPSGKRIKAVIKPPVLWFLGLLTAKLDIWAT